jgi:hypothetical protein
MAISTDTRVYLVKFNYTLTDGKFIFNDALELVNLIKNNDRGIEYLKTFDPITNKFVKISKADFLRFNSYNTEAMEFLNNYYFFK